MLLVVVKGALGVAVMLVMGSPISLEAEMSVVVNEMVTSGYPVAVQVTERLLPDGCGSGSGSEADGAAVNMGSRCEGGMSHNIHTENI